MTDPRPLGTNTLRRHYVESSARIAELSLENEALRGCVHDEIAANLAFRAEVEPLIGKVEDEDMPTFCARIVEVLKVNEEHYQAAMKMADKHRGAWADVCRERDAARAELARMDGRRRALRAAATHASKSDHIERAADTLIEALAADDRAAKEIES